MLRIGYRGFSTRSRVFKLSPQEYVNQVQQEKIENEQFKQALSQDQLEYNPKILSSHKLTKNRPIPINVELLKYKPLRLPKTHGNLDYKRI